MSEPLRGVVISHAGLARGLVEAAAAITGIRDGLVAVDNEGCDAACLRDRISAAIGGQPAVLFVDLPAGSCLIGAAQAAHDRAEVAVVCGMNLAMLLDFVFHRDVAPAAAAQRAASVGGRAIRTVP